MALVQAVEIGSEVMEGRILEKDEMIGIDKMEMAVIVHVRLRQDGSVLDFHLHETASVVIEE